MKDEATRVAIFRLRREGHGIKAIARLLAISKNTVKRVLDHGSSAVPELARASSLDEHLDRVRELFLRCKGNRVRVHEELAANGITVAYTTLTDFCRAHQIGVVPKERAGRYHFGPGEEMQFDTSPHTVELGGQSRKLQCASLTLCYSRLLFAQCYPTFNRFYAKVFLVEALTYFGGAARRCVIDNSSVVIAQGTGRNAIPAPEMAALAERFGFVFLAHDLGDKNRSGRVERPFHYIENNFYPGRTFADRVDLNRQLLVWCNQVNGKPKQVLKHAKPIELFAAERPALQPLPPFVPEVYALHVRTVDLEGYVVLHTNRYSTETELISRQVEVRETKDRVQVLFRHRVVTEHARAEDGAGARLTLPAHRHTGRTYTKKTGGPAPRLPEEATLRAQGPEFVAFIDALKASQGGRARRTLLALHRLFLDYPTEPLRRVLGEAQRFHLTDLERIERMLLRRLSGDLFRIGTRANPDAGDEP
ncbi:MAG: IS21 family transposase [Deferrisomatales bacterium]|nr:IS21 family transposase [Deferrisomatales bacterium]